VTLLWTREADFQGRQENAIFEKAALEAMVELRFDQRHRHSRRSKIAWTSCHAAAILTA
jgi:hypothetical protein